MGRAVRVQRIDMAGDRVIRPRACDIDGCKNQASCRDWCSTHYTRWRKYGDPHFLKLPPVEQRLLARVDKAVGGCWIWTGTVTDFGYGSISVKNKMLKVHRVSYELFVGPIPAGAEIDHLCHNPGCVNPEHLRPVTRKQNRENHRGSAQSNSRSGIRGVSWARRQKKWHARVGHNHIQYHLGFFDSIEAAERAVLAKRIELHTHNDLDRIEGVA